MVSGSLTRYQVTQAANSAPRLLCLRKSLENYVRKPAGSAVGERRDQRGELLRVNERLGPEALGTVWGAACAGGRGCAAPGAWTGGTPEGWVELRPCSGTALT